MIEQEYLDDVLNQMRMLKDQGDKALAQVTDEQIFETLDTEANSIGVIMKHVAGNMRSRWTDFLTTDGEKPDRNRDTEFELSSADSRAGIVAGWEDGWRRAVDAVAALSPSDLGRTVYIRGEAQSALQAINRQLMHYAAHVGQIVLLAKHYAGPQWRSLSIPKAARPL